MNPTPGQVQSIKQFVGSMPGVWSNTDAQVRAAMAAAQVPNPVASAPTVATPYTPGQLLGLLGAASLANLYAFPAIHDLFDSILAQDSARVLAAVSLLHGAGKVTDAEAAAIQSAVTATRPDPSWTSAIPWDVANLGRVADDFDIEWARHG